MIYEIDVSSLKEKLDSDKKLTLIDVRTEEEWKSGHLHRAELIPLRDLENRIQERFSNKDEEIIFQCRSGKRSLIACELLKKYGYGHVTSLQGGILAWIKDGFDIEK